MTVQKKPAEACPICKGSRFVCENHPRLSWPNECDCGAGDPCPVCNLGEPPAMPDDFVRDEEKDLAGRLRERLNEEARKRDSGSAGQNSDARASPIGWIAFGAACAAVVIGLIWWLR